MSFDDNDYVGDSTYLQDMDSEGALYVNFSEDEAASESRDLEPLPSGKYLMAITDCELKESKSAKNPGKPYYAITLTVVQDKAGGRYVGRKAFSNAMLFSPALFTITHIMKALGYQVSGGKVRIPPAPELIGKELVVGGVKVNETQAKDDPSKTYPAKFEPKSYFAKGTWQQGAGAVTTRSGPVEAASLLS